MSNFKAMRSTFEKHLNSLESDIQKQLHLKESEIKCRFESLQNDLRSETDSAERMSQDMIMMKDIDSDRQVFFALPEIQEALDMHICLRKHKIINKRKRTYQIKALIVVFGNEKY